MTRIGILLTVCALVPAVVGGFPAVFGRAVGVPATALLPAPALLTGDASTFGVFPACTGVTGMLLGVPPPWRAGVAGTDGPGEKGLLAFKKVII